MISISEPFIRRPVGTILLSIGLFLIGVVAYIFLPVASLPNVDFPVILVSALRPGAEPAVMAATIAAPLERHLGQIASVEQMNSTNSLGTTMIQLQFASGRSVDHAGRDVQAAISAAATDLPNDLPLRPAFRKINSSTIPIYVLALTSTTMTTSAIYDIADTILLQRLSQVPGVGRVTVTGSDQPAVRVALDTTALARAGISSDDVRAAIVNANPIGPIGALNGASQSEVLGMNRQMRSAAEFGDIVLRSANGNFLRLSDVAGIRDSVRNVRSLAWVNNRPAVVIQIEKQSDANVLDTIDHIKALMPELKSRIPASIEILPMVDLTRGIRAGVLDMEYTLIAAVILMMLLVAAFLRRLAPTIAAGVSVPLTLAGTSCALWIAGYSINNLSLIALTISVGFIVDDAIVMIENMSRNLELGRVPYHAARHGAKQIGFTVVSISLSLLAVFMPLLFMDGFAGQLLREFSLTLTFTIIISMLISLTVTPMICAHFITERRGDRARRLDRVMDGAMARVVAFYQRTLRGALLHPWATLVVFVATIGLTVVLYVAIPKAFFPAGDSGFIYGVTRASPDISFQALTSLQQDVAGIVGADPAVATLGSLIGNQGTNSGILLITLKPASERGDVSTQEVMERLRERISRLPNIRLFMVPISDLPNPRQSDSQYQYTLRSVDQAALQEWAPIVAKRMESIEGVVDVSNEQNNNSGMQLQLAIDRDLASRLGVRTSDIDNALNNAFSQRQIATIYTPRNQYMVVLETDPAFQHDPADLDRIFVAGANNAQVPLSALVRPSRDVAQLTVFHSQSLPSVTISFNLRGNTQLDAATASIERAVAELHLPEGIRGGFDGLAAQSSQATARLPVLFLMAVLTMYIVLGVLYESLAHPFTIISTLPSATAGALCALELTNTPMSVVAFVGTILVIGIVKKNGIMIVDFALEAERKQDLSSLDAILDACRTRFRPILMTTLATIFASIPLVVASGPGAELRRPLGIAVIGGLLVSQILTLYTTPVIYVLIDRLRLWRRRRRMARATGSGSVAGPRQA
ncbi:MAG: efflux RND transporter permease subunit [Alphaproteobacteria bacterium]|nr:efflux RND transporter permease subunit [Alphaproteobacteria bacterium]